MEKNLRATLIESRQRYKDLVEVNSDFAWEVGTNGTFGFVSPKGALRYTADEIVGKPVKDFVLNPENYEPLPFTSEIPLENVDLWMKDKNGNTACMLTSCVPLLGENRIWSGTRGVCRDVTIERANESALARARHREYLLNHIVFAIRDEIDPLNMLSVATTATTDALMAAGARIYRLAEDGGYSVAAEYGETEGIDSLSDSFTDLDFRTRTQETTIGDYAVLYTPTQYRQALNGVFALWRHKDDAAWEDDYRILLSDVANQLGIANEQIANHERIVALSRTDSLTGLLNRRAMYEEEVPRRIARLIREKKTAALFYVDLDNFKLVNDIRGHQAGDDVLLHLRQLMIDNSRPGDVIARLGGDEFAMRLDNISLETAKLRAEALLDSSIVLRQYSGTEDDPLGISIGMALYNPESGETLDGLTQRADEAMYAVKRAGKGGISVAPAPGESHGDGV
ncbi:MAG: sensor domain-containing diguanylate cyclase [Alphaproteobacteria bacterium]|nr:sensor domain-containing diguanylate cyclase [Alphaproteobacteria bacterium]